MLTHDIIAVGDAELCYNVKHCIWLYTDFCMLLYLPCNLVHLQRYSFLMFPDVSPIAERESHGGAVKPV